MEQIYDHSAKRLTRSAKGKVFGGICGGLAAYLDIDPVLVRVLYVGLTLISGGAFGVILYLIAWIIIPLDTGHAQAQVMIPGNRMSGRRMLGVLLVVVGGAGYWASDPDCRRYYPNHVETRCGFQSNHLSFCSTN
jgi:phage shock protein C